MGTRHVPDRYRAVIKPDTRLDFDAANSGQYDNGGAKVTSISPASPITGLAIRDQSTDFALRASGEQTEDLEAYANRRGLPVLDKMGLLFKKQSDTDQIRRGQDLPVPPAAWQPIDLVNTRFFYHATTTPDDYIVEVYQDIGGGIYTRTLDPSTKLWGAEVAVDAIAVGNAYPCILWIPRVDGYRLMIYRWGDDGTDYQVRAWYSDDQGATWTDSGFVLEEALDAATITSRHRLRAAYYNGQVLLCGHVLWNDTAADIERDRVVQWYSDDGGGDFAHVLTSDGSDTDNAGAWIDVTVWRGEFLLSRLVYDSGTTSVVPAFRRLASASYPWTSGSDTSSPAALTSANYWGTYTDPGAGADQYIPEGELAVVVMDDKAIYAYGRHCTGPTGPGTGDDGGHPVLRSADGAESWAVTGKHPAYPATANNGSMWWNTGIPGPGVVGVDNELMNFCAVNQRGRAVVITSWRRAGGAGATNYHAAIYLGGWQSVPMPSLFNGQDPVRRGAWEYTGCGMHLPSEGIWTQTLAGGATETLTSGRSVQVAGGVASVTNDTVPTTTVGEGIIGEWSLEVDSGTAFIEMRTSAATPVHYEIQVSITTTQVTLYDVIAAVVIGAAYTYTGERIRVRLAIESNDVVCWVRTDGRAAGLGSQDELTDPDRPWIEVARSGSIGVAAANPGMRVQFITGANSTVYWDEWMISSSKYTGQGLYNQTDRLKYGGSVIESPVYVGHGVKASAVTGPAAVGDTWQITGTADYPAAAMLPNVSPSPSHPHRATGILGINDGTIRWTFSLGSQSQSGLSPFWGVLLDGLNFGQPSIYLYYAAAWHLAGSVGYWSFTADRYGRSLVVNTGANANSAVIRRDELVGCLVEEVVGGFVTNQARVLSNEPGHINTTAGLSVPLKLVIDRSAAGWGAAPVVRIYPRRALLILDLEALSQQFSAIQIRAPLESLAPGPYSPPQYPPESYFEIGTFCAGPLWAMGQTPSWGYRLATEPNTELLTAEDETRTAYVRAGVRRRWSLGWSDPVSMHDMDDDAPDFMAGKTGGAPMALLRSTPVDLGDQLRVLKGAGTVIGYCPAIDTAGIGREDHWADGAMIGRITGSIERDNVVGDEERDEASRIQEWVFEEEL